MFRCFDSSSFICVLFLLFSAVDCEDIRNDRCVYDLKLEENYIKVTCEGDHPGVFIDNHSPVAEGKPVADDGSTAAKTGSLLRDHGNNDVNTAAKTGSLLRDHGNNDVNAMAQDKASLTTHKGHDVKNTIPIDGESKKLFLDALKNASNSIIDLRSDLLGHVQGISDIGNLLARGDGQLQLDLQKLRTVDNFRKREVREAILAAIQNQYNFLRTGMVTQNVEMTAMLKTMVTLVERTGVYVDTLVRTGSRLEQELEHVHDSVEKLQNRVTRSKRNNRHKKYVKKYSESCPKVISSIGDLGDVVDMGLRTGAVMRDAWSKAKRVYVMYGFSESDKVIEYASDTGFRYDVVSKTYELPVSCEGTGHAVLDNNVYCLKADERKIIKYDLLKQRVEAHKELPHNIGVHDSFPYDFGKFSDIDFATDEKGLWMIYATDDSGGKIVVAKLNEETLSTEESWITNCPKSTSGNAFMVCGVLYVLDSSTDVPTFVSYKFDTRDGREEFLTSRDIKFPNSMRSTESSLVSLSYNPVDEELYSWNGGKVEMYPVFFKRKQRG